MTVTHRDSGFKSLTDIIKVSEGSSSDKQKHIKGVTVMAKNAKQTSKSVASKASKILRDNRYSKTSKSVAGSALAQAKSRGNK